MGFQKTRRAGAADVTVSPLAYANDYLHHDWRVIALHTPDAQGRCSCWQGEACAKPGKHPRHHPADLPSGALSGTRDLDLIERWKQRWPAANIGICTGEGSGIWCLDCDGEAGVRTLKRLIREHEGEFPRTYRQRTGGGGHQFLFAYIPGIGNKVRFADGLDTRSDGGLIVAPPSLHASGRRYTGVEGEWLADIPIAAAPLWLVDLIRLAGAKGTRTPLVEGAKIRAGQRNATLFRLGCSMRYWGATAAAILAALKEDNRQRCQPPLPDEEVTAIAGQVSRYSPGSGSAGVVELPSLSRPIGAALPALVRPSGIVLPDLAAPSGTASPERGQCR